MATLDGLHPMARSRVEALLADPEAKAIGVIVVSGFRSIGVTTNRILGCMTTCSVNGCPDRAIKRGYCSKHYQRWRTKGDPCKVRRIRGDDLARFWSKVDKNGPVPAHAPHLGPCWLWRGWTLRRGYGRFTVAKRHWLAHRWIYELLVGPVPEGYQLDHLCRVTGCVRLGHLEVVTGDENIRRGYAARA